MKDAMKPTTDPTPGADDGSLVAPSDIAEMAGVSRAAVSNWRKRNDDFPTLAGGTPAKPLFTRAEVVAWLKSRDYRVQEDSGEGLVWAALNALRDSLRPDESAYLLLALACARKLSSEGGGDSAPSSWNNLRQAIQADGLDALTSLATREQMRDPRWMELVEVPDFVNGVPKAAIAYVCDVLGQVAPNRLGDVVDAALAKTARAKVRDGLEHGFVESRTSTALANLALASGGESVYDPACGVGSALVAAMRAGLKASRVVGHDISRYAVLQARQRSYLHNFNADIEVADVLTSDPSPDLKVDVVIAEPPFGLALPPLVHIADRRWRYGMAPKSSGDTLWLQHALAHLTDNGRGFVITPVGTLSRSGTDKGIRAELLRHGCVKALIALPPRMLPHVGANLVVWVLRPAQNNDRLDVHFIDATDVDDAETRIGTWYTDIAGNQALDVAHKVVDVRDLLAANADLTVQRWVDAPDRDPAEVAAAYENNWHKLYTVVEHIKGSSGSLGHFAGTTDARIFTVGDLIDQGVLKLRQGRVISKDVPTELQSRVVTQKHIRDGAVEAVDDEDDDVPAKYRNQLTNDGEVLVTTQHGSRAAMDASGGHLAVAGVHRLQVVDHNQISADYLALVLGGSWNDRFQVGSAVTRADIRLLEVPLVSTAEQVSVRLADGAAKLLVESGRQMLEHATALRASMLDALRYKVPLPCGDQ
jgi:SAM-dependent methyltransferase